RLDDPERAVRSEVHPAAVGLHDVGLVDAVDLVIGLRHAQGRARHTVADRADRAEADAFAATSAALADPREAQAARAELLAQFLPLPSILGPAARLRLAPGVKLGVELGAHLCDLRLGALAIVLAARRDEPRLAERRPRGLAFHRRVDHGRRGTRQRGLRRGA